VGRAAAMRLTFLLAVGVFYLGTVAGVWIVHLI
jgi:hypothetical protein